MNFCIYYNAVFVICQVKTYFFCFFVVNINLYLESKEKFI